MKRNNDWYRKSGADIKKTVISDDVWQKMVSKASADLSREESNKGLDLTSRAWWQAPEAFKQS